MNFYKLLVALVTLAVVVGEFDEGETSEELRPLAKMRASLSEILDFIDFLFGVPEKTVKVAGLMRAFCWTRTTNENWATIGFALINYAKWKLEQFEFFRLQGNDTEVFNQVTIKPGELVPVDIGGHQTSGFNGTEGVMFFDVKHGWQCFFYWRVPDANATEQSHLGVGCYDNVQSKIKQKEIKAYLKEPTKKTSLPLHLQTSDNFFSSRYCGDDSVALPFCIEGRISDSHKCTGYITLFPKSVEDVAEPLTGEITQKEIDGKIIPPTPKPITAGPEKPTTGGQERTKAGRFLVEIVVFVSIAAMIVFE